MITTELFLFLCYQCNLTIHDLEIITVGMALDYIQEYIEQQKPPKERKRKATQADFNAF